MDRDQTGAVRAVAGNLPELRHLWDLAGGALDELTAAAAGRLPGAFAD